MLTLLLIVLFVGGIIYLGFGLVFAMIALAFKLLWFGLNFIFSLGWFAIIAAATAMVLMIKLTALVIPILMVAAVLWIFWTIGKLIGRSSRGPAPSYAYEPPRGGCGWGGSRREETLNRLHRTLSKMDRRMRDLEDEMERRWR